MLLMLKVMMMKKNMEKQEKKSVKAANHRFMNK